MEDVLLVVHVLVTIALVALILIQRSEGGGLGIGGGSGGGGMGGLMTGRGTASLLTRATAILAGLFMLLSLAQAFLSGGFSFKENKSFMETEQPAEEQKGPGSDVTLPAIPTSGASSPAPANGTPAVPTPGQTQSVTPPAIPAVETDPAPATDAAGDEEAKPESGAENTQEPRPAVPANMQ